MRTSSCSDTYRSSRSLPWWDRCSCRHPTYKAYQSTWPRPRRLGARGSDRGARARRHWPQRPQLRASTPPQGRRHRRSRRCHPCRRCRLRPPHHWRWQHSTVGAPRVSTLTSHSQRAFQPGKTKHKLPKGGREGRGQWFAALTWVPALPGHAPSTKKPLQVALVLMQTPLLPSYAKLISITMENVEVG